jgi:hypothetical protein
MVLILKNGMTCNTVTRISTVKSTGQMGRLRHKLLLLTQYLFLKEQRSNCHRDFTGYSTHCGMQQNATPSNLDIW